MALTIEQKPKYNLIPANNEIIFSVQDGNQVANQVKVKYIAELYIEKTTAAITASIAAGTPQATLRVSPNNAGSGIFDLGPIACNYVSPDYLGGKIDNTNNNFSEYKGQDFHSTKPHPIHLIDMYSTNRKSCIFMQVRFKVESAPNLASPVAVVPTNAQDSDVMVLYNGIMDETDILNLDASGNYGFNLDIINFIPNDTSSKFLTNAGTTQYIKNNQYMTVAFFSEYDDDFVVGAGGTHAAVKDAYITVETKSGSTAVFSRPITPGNGGHHGTLADSNTRMQFLGIGTANITNSGITLPSNWDYYKIQLVANDGTSSPQYVSDTYYFYRQEDDCRYPTIRLTWLNKFGAWDYYNFNKKSINTLNAERTTYTQLKGEWNKAKFQYHGYRGGKKSYVNNVSENITLNTDYITEDEAIWLEELFISNDVFIVHDDTADDGAGYINKYIEPITIQSSDYIRKTKVNDKLIQYTFDILKSKNRKTHKA
jgi:hypothetical protein